MSSSIPCVKSWGGVVHSSPVNVASWSEKVGTASNAASSSSGTSQVATRSRASKRTLACSTVRMGTDIPIGMPSERGVNGTPEENAGWCVSPSRFRETVRSLKVNASGSLMGGVPEPVPGPVVVPASPVISTATSRNWSGCPSVSLIASLVFTELNGPSSMTSDSVRRACKTSSRSPSVGPPDTTGSETDFGVTISPQSGTVVVESPETVVVESPETHPAIPVPTAAAIARKTDRLFTPIRDTTCQLCKRVPHVQTVIVTKTARCVPLLVTIIRL